MYMLDMVVTISSIQNKNARKSTPMHETTIGVKMQYAIIIFTFTAIVTCVQTSNIKQVNNLDDLAKAIEDNAAKKFDDSQEIGDFESTTVKTDRPKIITNLTMSRISLPSVKEPVIKHITNLNFGDYNSDHEIGDFNEETTTPRKINDESFPSLRELASKDIAIEKKSAPKPLQTPTSRNENEEQETINVEKKLVEATVVNSHEVTFEEIKNAGANIKVDRRNTDNSSSMGVAIDQLRSNNTRNVLVSKFLKVDAVNGDIQFSLVDEVSDIYKSNPRKVMFASPIVRNGTDLLMQGGTHKGFFNPISDIRPDGSKDFSKSTFVGVPMNTLLSFLRAKPNTDGGIKKPNIGSIISGPEDFNINGVVNFIKSSARNIGDVVVNGR